MTIKKWTYLIPVILILLNLDSQAQDSLSVISRTIEHSSAFGSFVEPYTNSPELLYKKYKTSLSAIDISGDFRMISHQISPADGKGHLFGLVNASAYLKTSPKTQTWGQASYRKGEIKGMKWNSSSDLDRLYPYFQADTVGGDMHHEQYAFSGGFAHDYHSGQVGIEIDYRAQHEYRAIDPRPRNIVSDFVLNAGISQQWLPSYLIGIGLTTEVYKQVSDVAIYHPLGASPQWLMSGLGNMAHRFNTAEVGIYYRGRSFGGHLSMIPTHRNGIYIDLEHRYTNMERILSSLNETPINHYADHTSTLHFGYWHEHRDGSLWGINSSFYYAARRGRTHIIGDPSGGEYPIKGELPIFGRDKWGLELTLHYQLRHGDWQWRMLPSMAYHSTEIEIAYPHKHLRDQGLNTDLSIQVAKQISDRSLFRLRTYGGYQHHFTPHLHVPRATLSPKMLEYLDHTFAQMTSDRWHIGISPEYIHQLTPSIALRGAVNYRFSNLNTGTNNHITTITIGLIF